MQPRSEPGVYVSRRPIAKMGGFAETESLDRLRNPDKMNSILTILGLMRLHKEDRFHLGGSRVSRGASGLGRSHRGKCRQGRRRKSRGREDSLKDTHRGCHVRLLANATRRPISG